MAAFGEPLRHLAGELSDAHEFRRIIDSIDENTHVYSRLLTGLAGVPMHTASGGRSVKTLLRAPTTVPCPTVVPGATNTSAAIQASSSIVIFEARMVKGTDLKSCVPVHRCERCETTAFA